MDLPARVRHFLTEKPRFAAVATTNADNSPHLSLVWYDIDAEGRVRINSRPPRRWWANILRTGRVALAIADADDQYRWVGLSGVVEEVVTGEPAREQMVAFEHYYHPDDPNPEEIAEYRSQDRHMFVIRVTAIHDHLE